MPAFALPESLGERIDELAAAVRRQRLLRGGLAFGSILISLPALAIGADAFFETSGPTRGLFLFSWLLASSLAAWWFLVRRYRETIPAEVLAQIIEKQFPSLAERLRTLVELSEHAEPGNGSRTMMAILARETEKRSRKLDFHRAAPSRSIRFLAVAGVAAILAVGIFAFAGSGERVRRFVQPWRTPVVEPTFAIVVSSGDPVVKRGQPITVSGYLKKLNPNAPLPDAAAVLFREPGSAEIKKLPMLGDDKSAFALTRPRVDGDLEYCIEAEGQRSDWHAIKAVDAVELAAGGETVVTAPAYAAAARPEQKLSAASDIDALQHSRAKIQLKFNRSAVAVQLEWRPQDSKAPAVRKTVTLADNNTVARTEFPLEADGVLKWTLFAESDVRTEFAQVVRLAADAKPRFDRVEGLPNQPRDIRPGEAIDVKSAIADDIAIAKLEFEFGPADGTDDTLQREPVALPGIGSPRVDGAMSLRIPVATDGQFYRVRLLATDNRSVPELDLKPQTSAYPESGWVVLRVNSAARPFAEQDINARRDTLREQVRSIRELLTKAHEDVKKLRPIFRGRAKLELDQSIRFGDDLKLVREAREKLDNLATAQKLARDLAEGDVRTAEVQLKKSLSEADSTARDAAALAAETALAAALAKLGELEADSNAKLARALDVEKLKALADKQSKLATDPAKSEAEQKKLAEELAKLVEESETLRDGNTAADAARKRELAALAAKLAAEQKALDRAIGNSTAASKPEVIDELAKKQKALAEKVKAFSEKNDLATRIAQTTALDKKGSEKASDSLEKKAPLDALTEQEKQARELERFAEELEKSALERGDAKKAAQQLARWQEDLQRRAADGLKQTPRGDNSAERAKWAAEQTAIQKAIDKLALPDSPPLQKARQAARESAATAAEKLERDPATAPEALKKATEALQQLAEKTPTAAQRSQAAVAELNKLKKELDALQTATEDAKRNAKATELQQKLADAADKADELAKKLSQVDAAANSPRRDATVAPLQRSSDELRRGKTDDAIEGQKETRDRMERLKDALEGRTPADDAAAELARLQKELTAKLAAQAKPKGEELQRLQRQQAEIARQLRDLQAQDKAAELQAAREAAKEAESALKNSLADVDELRKKSQQAQATTEQLAKKLNPNGATPKTETDPLAGELPSEKQADEARKLAREQRELREELARVAEANQPVKPTMADPLKDHAQMQRQLAADAEKLAKETKSADAEAAAKSAAAAADKLERGDTAGAKADADAAAEKLKSAGADELAKKQTELAKNAAADAKNPGQRMSRQVGKQKELSQNATELAEKLGPGQEGEIARDAAKAMDDARKLQGANRPAESAEARQRASEALEKLSKELAGQAPAPNGKTTPAQGAAEASRDAGSAMQEARWELGKPAGKPAPAMNRAADKLREAAGKLGTGESGETGRDPGQNAGPPDKPSTQTDVPSVVQENLGKAWGDLPGDVKTKITQELKAKYGDDYARLIKLYFEQLAERK